MKPLLSDPSHADSPAICRDPVLVWDLPTRLGHWLLAASFIGAYLTGESESLRALHALLGYTAAGLIAFRLAWGVAGTRYARFTGFAWSPGAALSYLRGLFVGRPERHVGHNPLGSWAVVLLLAAVAATAGSGWAALTGAGPGRMDDLHETVAGVAAVLVVVHVAAVIISSVLHGENLVRAMVTGTKRVAAAAGAAGPRRLVAALLAAVVVAFWTGWIPAPGIERGKGPAALSLPQMQLAPTIARRHHRDDDDD
jgi:cytochrome b